MKKRIVISTGGSGGHVIPATVVYEHLKDVFEVFLITDKRGTQFSNIEKNKIFIIDTPKFKSNIFLVPLNILLIIYYTFKSIIVLRKNNIDTLISTGGYMSLPICLSAILLGVEIFLWEPNIVLGRTNKLFLRFSKKIYCYSDNIINLPKKFNNKISKIYPLLRKQFYDSKYNINTNRLKEKINLLIIGGSQGAKLFDTELKKTIIYLSKKYKLNIYQQVNIRNKNDLETFYKENNINFNLFNFEENLVEIMSKINFCITRAGASTLSELTFLNIPYLAIPYPFAKDDHQYQNALFYKKKNCCWLLNQMELNEGKLIDILKKIIENNEDYNEKRLNMKKFSYQNTWDNINQKLINTINEN